MPMTDVDKLVGVGIVPEQAKRIVEIAQGGSGDPVSSDDVTVPAITADGFSFAGGTLTEFCQAIADAIPAA